MAAAQEIFEAQDRSIITGTANILTRAGKVCRILVVSGTGQIDVYDHPSGDNNQVFSKAITAPGDIYVLMVPLKFGLRVKLAAAGTLCVTWSGG